MAEFGAAFLCADLELKLEDRNDHAAYIGSWLQVLENDHTAVFRAADFLHGLQRQEDSEDDATRAAT